MLSRSELETILDRAQEWTRSADQKVSILVALEALLLALPLPLTLDWLLGRLKEHNYAILILWGIAMAALILAFERSLHALMPRLSSGKQGSALYFGDIATYSRESYRELVESMSDADYLEDLVSQIHTCSLIAHRKHKSLRQSIQALVLSLALAAAAYSGVLL